MLIDICIYPVEVLLVYNGSSSSNSPQFWEKILVTFHILVIWKENLMTQWFRFKWGQRTTFTITKYLYGLVYVQEGTYTLHFFYIYIVQLGTNVNFSLKQEWGKWRLLKLLKYRILNHHVQWWRMLRFQDHLKGHKYLIFVLRNNKP